MAESAFGESNQDPHRNPNQYNYPVDQRDLVFTSDMLNIPVLRTIFTQQINAAQVDRGQLVGHYLTPVRMEVKDNAEQLLWGAALVHVILTETTFNGALVPSRIPSPPVGLVYAYRETGLPADVYQQPIGKLYEESLGNSVSFAQRIISSSRAQKVLVDQWYQAMGRYFSPPPGEANHQAQFDTVQGMPVYHIVPDQPYHTDLQN